MLLLSYGGAVQETKVLLVAWEEEWSLLLGREQSTDAPLPQPERTLLPLLLCVLLPFRLVAWLPLEGTPSLLLEVPPLLL